MILYSICLVWLGIASAFDFHSDFLLIFFLSFLHVGLYMRFFPRLHFICFLHSVLWMSVCICVCVFFFFIKHAIGYFCFGILCDVATTAFLDDRIHFGQSQCYRFLCVAPNVTRDVFFSPLTYNTQTHIHKSRCNSLGDSKETKIHSNETSATHSR